MTQVDFYLVNDDGTDSRNRVACRLTDKAFRQGRRVYIYSDNEDTVEQLDRLLWTFNPGSFVPHELHLAKAIEDAPVAIGSNEPPVEFCDVLVSIAAEVPSFFSRFERVAEVVGATEQEKQKARDRFRFYRDRGYELETHHI